MLNNDSPYDPMWDVSIDYPAWIAQLIALVIIFCVVRWIYTDKFNASPAL